MMNAMKTLTVAVMLGLPLTAMSVAQAQTETKPADTKAATPAKPTTEAKPAAEPKADSAKTGSTKTEDKDPDKKFTASQLKAFGSKCSAEADAKGLTAKAGKQEARKEYRASCLRKLGASSKKE